MESGILGGYPAGSVTLDTASTATAGTALNAAISTLGTGGGTIFIPAGTWTIDTPVLINQVAVTFRGASNGTTLLQFPGSTVTTAFKMADTTQRRVVFDNIRIESTNSGAGTAIDASYFVNSIFHNVRIGNTGTAPNVGILFGGPGTGVTFYNSVRDSRIQVAGTGSIGISYTANANSNVASNVRIIGDTNSTGVLVNAHAIKLDHIDIEANCLIGIDVAAAGHECLIDHPYLESVAGTGIRLASGVKGVIVLGGFIASSTTANITDNGATSPRFINPRVNFNPYLDRNAGTATLTPGGVSTVNIAHGVYAAPSGISVVPANANARGAPAFYVTSDATNIVLNFASNLTAATSYSWSWLAQV